MTAISIDGKKQAAAIKQQLKSKISVLTRAPVLAVIWVGDDAASSIYIRAKEKACQEVGIKAHTFHLDANISQAELQELIIELNQDEEINGILVQLPLPPQIDEAAILATISPNKDVDGFHPFNAGRLLQKSTATFIPCTPKGIMALIQSVCSELRGLNAVVIGRSNIVGLPTAELLLQQDCTVTVAHSKSKDLAAICRTADILVVAVGKAGLITPEYIKPGAIIIDVGINRTERGIEGDVDYAAAMACAGYITPVPGGVGPMTIAMLLENTYEAFLRQQ